MWSPNLVPYINKRLSWDQPPPPKMSVAIVSFYVRTHACSIHPRPLQYKIMLSALRFMDRKSSGCDLKVLGSNLVRLKLRVLNPSVCWIQPNTPTSTPKQQQQQQQKVKKKDDVCGIWSLSYSLDLFLNLFTSTALKSHYPPGNHHAIHLFPISRS